MQGKSASEEDVRGAEGETVSENAVLGMVPSIRLFYSLSTKSFGKSKPVKNTEIVPSDVFTL